MSPPIPTLEVAVLLRTPRPCFQAGVYAHGCAHTGRASGLLLCSLNIYDSISFHEDFIIMAVKGCGILLPPAARILT